MITKTPLVGRGGIKRKSKKKKKKKIRHYSYQPENVELESLIDLTLLTIMPLFSAEVKNLKFFIASFVKPYCIILFCNFKAN